MNLRYIDEKKVKGKILRILEINEENVYFYFNQEGVYTSTELKDAKLMHGEEYKGVDVYRIGNEQIWSGHLIQNKYGKGFGQCHYYEMSKYGINFGNPGRLNKAIARLKEGDTIEILDQYILNTCLDRSELPTGLDRFVTKIETPSFERDPENKKKDTFDRIHVTVCTVKDWEEDRKSYFKKHKKEIFKMVVDKLEANKRFQKFGIPVNFLKVSATIKKNCTVEFVFEMKKL